MVLSIEFHGIYDILPYTVQSAGYGSDRRKI